MIFKKIVKFIPSLIYTVLLLGIFYWQFNTVFSTIIESFKEERLLTLYSYLFIYLFGVYIFTIGVVNLLHYSILHNRLFVQISSLTLLLFYGFSFQEFYHIIEYFVDYPLSQNTITGVLFFIFLSFGYALYSIIILFFKENMPLSHILVFLFLALLYALYFINNYGTPLGKMLP
jgi:hypothetical protein